MVAGTAAEIGIAGTAGAAISSLWRGAAACNVRRRAHDQADRDARDRAFTFGCIRTMMIGVTVQCAGITTISAYIHRPAILPRLISQGRTTPKLSKCARTCCIRMFEDRDRMDRSRCERASCASSRTLDTPAGRSLLAIILIVRILT
jgi:hypothetical protein